MRALVLVLIAIAQSACGSPSKLKPVNGPCANNSDCADNICHAGICASAKPLKNGAACDGNGVCRSFRCVSGRCEQGSNPAGSGCLHGEECADRTCASGHCGPLPVDGGVDAPPADLLAEVSSAQDRTAREAAQAADRAAVIDLRRDMAFADTKPKLDTPVAGCAPVLGKGCTQNGTECGSAATCLLTAGTLGVCTCTCTVDDPKTPLVNEDTCPNTSLHFCKAVTLSSGSTQSYCFKRCSPKLGSNDCSAPIACVPSSASFSPAVGAGVCLLPGCSKDADCPVLTATTCTTQNPALTCAATEVCVPLTTATTSGRCGKPGKCDLASGLCIAHALGNPAAKVGDPCKADTECGGIMRCQLELDLSAVAKKAGQSCSTDEECCSGHCVSKVCTQGLCAVNNRNGYCTIPGCEFASTLPIRACPTGSTCNRVYTGGLCQKTCALASATDCRNHPSDRLGDYECRAWNGLTLGGVMIADAPVCDFGTGMPCSFLQGSGLDCSSVGLAPNSTQMGCRSLSNVALAGLHDPLGYCLDNTASGAQLRSPMPTP